MIIREKIDHLKIIQALNNLENERIIERHKEYTQEKIELYTDYVVNNYLSYFLDEDISIEEENSIEEETTVTTQQNTTNTETQTDVTTVQTGSTTEGSNLDVVQQTTTVDTNTQDMDKIREQNRYDDFINKQKSILLQAGKDILTLGQCYLTFGFKKRKLEFTRLDPRFTKRVDYLNIMTNQTEPYAYYTKVVREEFIDEQFTTVNYIYVYALDGLYIYSSGNNILQTGTSTEYELVSKYPYFVKLTDDNKIKEAEFKWGKIPVISSEEINFFDKIYPFIKEIISIQETGTTLYNDLPDSILVIKNYDGTDLEQAKKEMNLTRLAKVSGDGDMKAVVLPTEGSTYQTLVSDITKRFFKLLGLPEIENFGNSSGVALKYIYKQLELCTNFLEPVLEKLVEKMLWAYQDYFDNHSHPMFTVIFNTTIIEDDKEKIENIMNSRGFINDDDLRKLHPYYDMQYVNLDEELPIDVYSTNIDIDTFEEDDLTNGDSERYIKPLFEGNRVRTKV